jgi:hypothetical protein
MEGFVSARWKVPAADRLWTLNQTINALEAICKERQLCPHDVRLVFGFDS